MSAFKIRCHKGRVVSLDDVRLDADERASNLSEEEIEYRWALATTFYPEFNEFRSRLAILSIELSDDYVKYMVHQKCFNEGEQLAASFQSEYLTDLCGANQELIDYGHSLIESGKIAELSVFVELCDVLSGCITRAQLEDHIRHKVVTEFTVAPEPFNEVSGSLGCEIDRIGLESYESDEVGVDVLSDLKASLVGRLYRKHIKGRPALRGLALSMWKYLCPLCIAAKQFGSKISLNSTSMFGEWLVIEKLGDYVGRTGVDTIEVLAPAMTRFDPPGIHPACYQQKIDFDSGGYNFPAIYVAKVRGAEVFGGTNLIKVDGKALCHDLYDFNRDYTSEELHGRTRLSVGKKKISFLANETEPCHLDEAASFVDAIAVNYAHWLTEVLPRVMAFCADERFSDVPLIVNDGLHDNIMESLMLAAGHGRKIVTLPVGKVVQVDELYIASVTGYVPFEPRGARRVGDSDGKFSPVAINCLREHMHSLVDRFAAITWPEKIYIKRRSGARNIMNASEIEKKMVESGYTVVDTAALTFLQQVCLFSNAKIIVGASGAAFANVLFSQPSTKVLIIISHHVDMVYGYWCNVLGSAGVSLDYLIGEISEGQNAGVHSDFDVDSDALATLLEKLERS